MAINNIYLDSCCYIDMVTGLFLSENANDARNVHCWYCMQFVQAAKDEKIKLLGSIVLPVECTHIKNDKKEKFTSNEIQESFDVVFMSGKIMKPVFPTPRIVKLARSLGCSDHVKIKPFDALHLATAADCGCAVFVTTDEGILQQSEQIKEIISVTVTNGEGAKPWLPKQYLQGELLFDKKLKPKLLPTH